MDQCFWCKGPVTEVETDHYYCPTCEIDSFIETIAVERADAPRSFFDFMARATVKDASASPI